MDGFNSVEELYQRLLPALKSKSKELKRIGLGFIKENDIWNYLKNNIWCKKDNLTLDEMVNDILMSSNQSLEDYLKNKLINKRESDVLE